MCNSCLDISGEPEPSNRCRPVLIEPSHVDGLTTIYSADCLTVLRQMPDHSIDAVVTDPPYAINVARGARVADGERGVDDDLALMGAPMLGMQSANWSEKATHSRGYADNDPHAFGRWCELWASECLRVLKPGGHLVAFGGTRTWHRLASAVEDVGFEVRDSLAWLYGSGFPKSLDVASAVRRRVGKGDLEPGPDGPGSDSTWRGWGTALKPGFEPIVLARKPLHGTVAENVVRYGTGALNIDACRESSGCGDGPSQAQSGARWPANVLLDEQQAGALDASAEATVSRFFWVAKPAASERVRVGGVSHPTVKPLALMRRLVRLVTPPGGIVLDPFAGSGTTVEACVIEGFKVVAAERDARYLPLILQRVDRRTDPVRAVVRGDEDLGLFAMLRVD